MRPAGAGPAANALNFPTSHVSRNGPFFRPSSLLCLTVSTSSAQRALSAQEPLAISACGAGRKMAQLVKGDAVHGGIGTDRNKA